jgi:hypothetical protein
MAEDNIMKNKNVNQLARDNLARIALAFEMAKLRCLDGEPITLEVVKLNRSNVGAGTYKAKITPLKQPHNAPYSRYRGRP